MVRRMRRVLPLLLAGLTACPPVNSQPCAGDDECSSTQRCRRGACGPICADDTECGSGQVCTSAGVCGARPECARTADCALGFTCTGGRCQCQDDTACTANQQCVSGTCQARKPCSADADCLGTGGRCEVTQGLCLPVCRLPQDCAPNLDPRLAFAIYTCVMGTCTRRCTTDVQCGGAGFICSNGLCTAADCATAADCPMGQYCTSATFGRCQGYTLCTSTAQCLPNYECKRFEEGQCPPGFDCTQRLCLELPRCLADGDCVTGTPPMQMPAGYCEEGHCQPSPACTVSGQCGSGKECIGGVCVPSVCRGHPDCGADGACIDGACLSMPAPGDINLLRLTPTTGWLIEGDTFQLRLLAFKLDGTSFPLTSATWEVKDALGQPSTAATVTPAGLVTGVTAGVVKVKGSVTGAFVPGAEATLTILPAITAGRRVIVVDAATRAPLGNVAVRACETVGCTTPVDVTTGADGLALFPALGSGAYTFTAVSQATRSDGLPTFERASLLGATGDDVLLPLRENPVQAQAGFNSSVSFSDVSTTGSYWAGFVTSSAWDVPSLTPQGLLGDSFFVELPGIGQQVPVPGAVVLYTSPGLGIPQEVKGRALSVAQPGKRFMAAWAGRAYLESVLSLRSTDFLSYLGAFDYALSAGATTSAQPFVPDALDINGNGRCSDPQKCPLGDEEVPDYGAFSMQSFQPRRQQKRRTEVVLPRVPSTFDSVLVAAVEVDANAGMLPTGFANRAAGPPGQDGTRPVDPITLRSGPAYDGVEIATPGLWALAGNAAGTSSSGRLSLAATLPSRVLVTPFLPAPADSSFQPTSRTFDTGQPAWASIYSTGGELARVALTGTEVRHVLYFELSGQQTSIPWPVGPAGPGVDPATEAGGALEVVAVDLISGVSVQQVFEASGITLSSWANALDGYSRLDR
ncbi:MAG: hypothetical protein AMXMBFR34_13630 [Myxococcaceae bacterium]